MLNLTELHDALKKQFSGKLNSIDFMHEQLTVEVSQDELLELMMSLRDDFQFELLVDLCGVDYLHYGEANWETDTPSSSGFGRGVFAFEEEELDAHAQMDRRFAVVYHLLSISQNLRIRIKVFPDSKAFPQVPSISQIWNSADWYEREAFDLFGVVFDNHPDLRRILTDYGFVGHPLRKDFPLQGKVEVRYSPEAKKVVYEPVSIDNRVNVPKVLRD